MNTRMKPLGMIMRLLAATLCFSASVATAGTLSNHSGVACQKYFAFEETHLRYGINGVSVYESGKSIVCPLVRRTVRTNGAIAYVDVIHVGDVPQTTKCTLFSHDRNGDWRAAISGTTTGTGERRIKLSLVGAGKSNKWSDYTVHCNVPGEYRGQVVDIDLDEQ